MPGAQGPATSLWPRGRVGDILLFGRSRFAWIGTLMKYAIAFAVGAVAWRVARDGQPLGWAGLIFSAFFLVVLTRSEFSSYEVRVDEKAGTLIRLWKPLFGGAATEAVAAADIEEFHFEEDEVSSVTMVMKDGRRIGLDSGRAAEPLRDLARDASRALGVRLLETKTG